MTNAPSVVEGPLRITKVNTWRPYTRYTVDDWEVDPTTIQAVGDVPSAGELPPPGEAARAKLAMRARYRLSGKVHVLCRSAELVVHCLPAGGRPVHPDLWDFTEDPVSCLRCLSALDPGGLHRHPPF